MSMTILVCPCGRRLKAAGMLPGKSGRCPSCGRTLRLPEAPPAEAAVSDDDVCAILRLPEPAPAEPAPAPAVDEDEWNWQGTYDLDPAEPPRPKFRPLHSPPDPASGGRQPPVSHGLPGDLSDGLAGDLSGGLPDPLPVDLPADSPDGRPADPSPADPAAPADAEWSWQGTYDLGAGEPAPAPAPEQARAEDAEIHPAVAPVGWVPKEGDDADAALADPWWPPRLLYPLRGAEGLAMVAALGGTGWVMGTLIPEYCLGILADAELLGTPSMGHLVVLISALPVLVLSPLVVIYGLQYLARVLVASSEGETRPPRPPDRNADGLLNGVGSWLLWLALGASVGLLPLAVYAIAASGGASWHPGLAAALGLAGLPYALMALLMTFLHDDPLAARPGAVLGAIARLGPSFLGLSLTIAALGGLMGLAVAAALALRAAAFWVYIPASLAVWWLAVWLPIVAMHTLGSYYAPRRERLNWRRKRLRWGAS